MLVASGTMARVTGRWVLPEDGDAGSSRLGLAP
jgi:hypothetical protein